MLWMHWGISWSLRGCGGPCIGTLHTSKEGTEHYTSELLSASVPATLVVMVLALGVIASARLGSTVITASLVALTWVNILKRGVEELVLAGFFWMTSGGCIE